MVKTCSNITNEEVYKSNFLQFCKISKNPLDSMQTQWYHLTCTQQTTVEAHQMRKHRISADVPEQLKSGKEHKVTDLTCQLVTTRSYST